MKMNVENLNLFYGEHQALFDVNLPVPEHKVVALIGPSGCGKSTFLRTLNRMNDLIDGVRVEGDISLDGEDIYTSERRGEGLLLMGNESRGLSEKTRSLVSKSLRIPSFGDSGAESLNVACACAIALSEFRRR